MAAHTWTFGVEIECFVPAEAIREARWVIGAYHHGIQAPNLPAGWNLQRDGSLSGSDAVAVEVVSPVLLGLDGLTQVETVMATLRAMGAKVNHTCGFHVHVGFANRTVAELRRVVCMVASQEHALYAITGSHKREGGRYCCSVRDSRLRVFEEAAKENIRDYECDCDRMRVLNLLNMFYGSKRTLEFRVFGGTLNGIKACAYIQVAIGLVDKAVRAKVAVPFDPRRRSDRDRTSALYAGGQGRVALNRLLMTLGWQAGMRMPEAYGLLREELRLPSCKELRRLADKYDAELATA